jgi:hypothetical protein
MFNLMLLPAGTLTSLGGGLLLKASLGFFPDMPPEHAPERFVFPWQPLPKFSEALRAGQETL